VGFGLLRFGVLLGIGAAAPIGPVNVEIARRTLRGGFWAGFALGCGAVSVDVFYAILSSQGIKRLVDHAAFMKTLGYAGAAMLFWLGATSLRAAWRATKVDPLDTTEPHHAPRVVVRNAYLTGVLMTLLNPMTLAFWFVAVPGTLGPITKEPQRDLPMICAGVFFGTLAWVVVFTGLLSLATRRARSRGTTRRRHAWLAVADAIGGFVLLGFAVLALWRLSKAFL
jgi:L-lysine exporter family protein LysE/ArgO